MGTQCQQQQPHYFGSRQRLPVLLNGEWSQLLTLLQVQMHPGVSFFKLDAFRILVLKGRSTASHVAPAPRRRMLR